MSHIEILESIALTYASPRYLEIGLGDCSCFLSVAVQCREAHGVDVPNNPYGSAGEAVRPYPNCTYHDNGSDDFFAHYWGAPFDLVFIDGSHWAEQVRRDWHNSLKVLAPLGTIALHDTWSPTEEVAKHGSDTAWQVAEEIENNHMFEAFTLPVHPGLTLARPKRKRFTQL